nr:unnamed protein product [Callosobruchus chinensis]
MYIGYDKRKDTKPHNLTDEGTALLVHEHIDSFPRVESHYCRKDSTKQYLGSDLNISIMHRLYCEDFCASKNIQPVSRFIYQKIFHQYEPALDFFIPKKDQCYKCNAYKSATDKTLLLEEYESHKKREKDAMLMKKKDKEKAVAEKGSSFRAVTFDLQAILQVPFAGDNQIFYKLKLNVYNFTIFDASNSNGYCYVWDETHGKKGSTEIGTCILKYLYELPETVTHVSSFSDTCGGQNRNKYVAAAMLFAVNKIHHLNVIDLKFMESGHSYLEADAMHATIERARKHKSIYTTREWSVLIPTARRNPRPYYVNNLRFDDFYDLQELAATMTPNTTTNTNQEKVQWLKIRWMRFEKTDPYLIKYKYELSDEEFLLIDVAGRRKRGRQQGWSSYELSKKYSQRIPISLKKKNDLLFLLRTKLCSSKNPYFYTNNNTTYYIAVSDSRKRLVNRQEWKREKAKKKRYVHVKILCSIQKYSTLFFRHSRQQLPEFPTCSHKTKVHQCSSLTMTDIRKFNEKCYCESSKTYQDMFILKHCITRNPRRPGTKIKENVLNKPKTVSVKYNIYTSKGTIPVCKKAFVSILGIGKSRVERILKDYHQKGALPAERRGGDRVSQRSLHKKQAIRNFIESITCCETHYARNKTVLRRYLPCELSIVKLWKMYNSRIGEHLKVKQCFFRNIFVREYNIGFGSPKIDVCSKCLQFSEKIKKISNQHERIRVMTEQRIHKLRSNAFYDLLREDNPKIATFSFDCQKNLPLPKIPDQACYFSMQINLYNFTMVTGHSKSRLNPETVKSFIWTECGRQRSSNEIVSAVFYALKNFSFDEEVERVRLVADGCWGQNKNSTMVGMVQYWLQCCSPSHIKCVELVYPVVGHSFFPPDRAFAQIEKKRTVEVDERDTDTEQDGVSDDSSDETEISDDYMYTGIPMYTGKDGQTKWSKMLPPSSQTKSHNLVLRIPGPVKAVKSAKTILQRFSTFIDDTMIDIIVICTNIKIE